MNEDRIRWDAAEMSALLEQMWTALEQIEIAFLRASECASESRAGSGLAGLPAIAEKFQRLQEEMTSSMENAAEIGKICAKCEAAVAETVDRLRLPL